MQELKKCSLNPYVVNCIIDFLSNRSKRVVVDGEAASFLPITRGVPQGTVLRTYLFSMMVNDIKTVSPSTNIIVKFADDLTLSVLVNAKTDISSIEVENITKWADINIMNLNLKKAWEIIVRGRRNESLPSQTGRIFETFRQYIGERSDQMGPSLPGSTQ